MESNTAVAATATSQYLLEFGDESKNRSKYWCFTNFRTDCPILFITLPPLDMQCLEYQTEICPTTGRIHHQGWICFNKPQQKSAIRSQWPGITMLPCRGTWEHNHVYCTADWKRAPGTEVVKFGVFPESKQGQRAEWNSIADSLRNGTTMSAIICAQPNLAVFGRALQTLSNAIQTEMMAKSPLVRSVVNVFWVWGEPGVGKSSQCFGANPGITYGTNIEPDGRIWFNGYSPTFKVLVIDEVKSTDDSPLLRRILDPYPLYAPVKLGEPVVAAWETVYLISNDHPPVPNTPIGNRITDVIHCVGTCHRKERRYHTWDNRTATHRLTSASPDRTTLNYCQNPPNDHIPRQDWVHDHQPEWHSDNDSPPDQALFEAQVDFAE